ncbi:hypothetical protein FPZ12_032385 [Amycolatopsis acidicola]|uniref:Lipoprotein n=1 Tax=Amycolatopsis acidicola TaxID=2596893 RepID=A0A5N0UUZ1_9PSEU|nr:hypothetical protein [Amycolatopsis acidicola]KAA9154305.1 hypothetical protein FPZ12_032385 [Amycolatopsis acidicola]
MKLAAIAVLALFLTACGSSASGSGAPKADPDALWSAYVTALPKADASAVCPLFTGEGAHAFAQAWEATDCSGAVSKAAAEFSGTHASPHTKDTKGNLVTMTDCGVGSLTAQKVDGGWQFSDYAPPPTVGYCGG